MSETKIEFDLTGNPKGNLVDLFDDLKKPADPAAPVMDKGGQAEQDGQTPAGNEAAASQQEPQKSGEGQSAPLQQEPPSPGSPPQEAVKSRFLTVEAAEKAAREWDRYKSQLIEEKKKTDEENLALREMVAKSVAASKRIGELEDMERRMRPLVPYAQVAESLDEELAKVVVPPDEMTGQDDKGNTIATREDRWRIFQADPLRYTAWLTKNFDKRAREISAQERASDAQQLSVIQSLKAKYPDIFEQATIQAIDEALGESASVLRDESQPLQMRARLLEAAYRAVKGMPASSPQGTIVMTQEQFDQAVAEKVKEIQGGQILDSQRRIVQQPSVPGGQSFTDAIREMESLSQSEKLPFDRTP
jgi:hypothetical protein